MRLNSKFIYAKSEVDISAQPKTDFKIMLVMHGLGDSLEPYKIFTQEVNVTNLHYLLLDAPMEYFTGLAWFIPDPKDPKEAVIPSTQLVLNEINLLIEEGFKPEDILLCGFSQGGCMALNVAKAFGQKLGGVAALSPKIYPYMLESFSEEFYATPLFMAHGTFDSVIPFDQTKSFAHFHEKPHSNLVWKEYSMDHEIDIDEIHDLRDWLNENL